MPFFAKAVVVFLKALVCEVLYAPSRAVDAVRAAYVEHARNQVIRIVMRPNWAEDTDKAYLLRCVLRAERVELVDWHYEWESAHIYAPGATAPMVIQMVEHTYRVCDVAQKDVSLVA